MTTYFVHWVPKEGGSYEVHENHYVEACRWARRECQLNPGDIYLVGRGMSIVAKYYTDPAWPHRLHCMPRGMQYGES